MTDETRTMRINRLARVTVTSGSERVERRVEHWHRVLAEAGYRA